MPEPSRNQKPVIFPLVLDNQQQLIRLGLVYFIDASPGEEKVHIAYYICYYNAVKGHEGCPPVLVFLL